MTVRYKALVVDDDVDICRYVSNRLKAMGHESDCVNCIEDARSFVNGNRYDYVILDMELPVRYGAPPDVSTGVFFLSTLREKFKRDELPVIVITAKMDNGQNRDLPSRIFYEEANDMLLKPLEETGDHTLEDSILKFVEKRKGAEPAASIRKEWLFRDPEENDQSVMHWRTVAKDGTVRRYTVAVNSIRGRLLYCINKMRFKNPVIYHMDLITASSAWSMKTYYPSKGGAPRGPLKGHVAAFRRELGMKITYVENGITVEQPED